MHNLHLALTYADSPAAACFDVENYIEGWGDENNWRHISGCISEDDEVDVNTKDGRFFHDNEEMHTIKGINETVRAWMNPNASFMGQSGPNVIKMVAAGEKPSRQQWWELIQYAKHMEGVEENLANLKGKEFDVRELHTFRSYEFNESGVTKTNFPKSDGDKLYVVFIDMHS